MERAEHPALRKMQRDAAAEVFRRKRLDAGRLMRLFLVAGDNDVRFVEIGRARRDDRWKDAFKVLDRSRRLINFEVPMNFQFIQPSQEKHR